MKIKLTSVYVVDQEKALRFYTEVLGFVKKANFSQAPFRWLTTAGTGIRRSCGFSITSKRTYRAVSTSTW